MSHFRDFICLFLVALAAHTCTAATSIEEAKNIVANIDEIIETANSDAEEFKAAVTTLSEKLTGNVEKTNAELIEARDNYIDTIEERIDQLIATADRLGADISSCTIEKFTVIAIVKGVIEDGVRCMREEVKYTKKQGQSLIAGIDFSRDTLVGLQQAAKICISRFDESSQSAAETTEAVACIEKVDVAVQLWKSRFESKANISPVESLFDVHESRVEKCGSVSLVNLADLALPADRMVDDIVACAIKKVPAIGQEL